MIKSKHIHPLNVGNLVEYAFNNGKQIFLLSLPGNFIILLLFSLMLLGFYDYTESIGADTITLNVLGTFNNILILSLTSVNVFYLLIGNDKDTYVEQVVYAFKKTLWVLAPLIVATFFYAALIIFGVTLLIIPGILVFTYFGIYSQVVAFEKKGIITSLLRSRELVKGSFWKVLIMLLTIILISNIALFLFGVLILIPLPEVSFGVEVVATLLSYLVIMPFLASYYAFLYFDLRSRQEAFDYPEFEKERIKVLENIN